MTKDRALAVAREVIAGKTSSYVQAAMKLAAYVIAEHERAEKALIATGVESIEAFDAKIDAVIAQGAKRIAAKIANRCQVCGLPFMVGVGDVSTTCRCEE